MELLQELSGSSNEQILKLVLDEDELSWQHIIYDLVRSEQMDPWDINMKQLTSKFLDVIRKLQRLDFRISGKIVLASAVLLKMKSDRLLDEDLTMLDELISSAEDDHEIDLLAMDYEEFVEVGEPEEERPRIYPRTPQPRQRKVSVYDLVTALEQALDVTVKRERRALDAVDMPEVTIPKHDFDVSDAMNGLLATISTHYQTNDQLIFQQLLTSTQKRDVVLTFIPLLHLTNERRVDLEQPEHFGDILVHLLDDSPVKGYQEPAVEA